ncbi:MAG TPA: type II secretion system F family protein [Candidatus Paceibacterota bacterium]|nr:type II secretion system F family protein [Candidatus Paceibacterota bacterium]
MSRKKIENPAELVAYIGSFLPSLPKRRPTASSGGMLAGSAMALPMEDIEIPAQPVEKKPRKPLFSGLSLGGARFTLKDQVFFAKRLSFLINAGVPLIEGLHIMRDQSKGRAQRRMLERVIEDVSSGQTLSKSFAKFPKVFGDFTVSILKVGESSGTLSQSLTYLAEELKKKQVLRRKMVGAFVYPAVITVATLGITAFLMLYLFPKIMPIFASLHTQLPLSTRMVMGTSVFLQHWGVAAMFGFIVFIIVLLICVKKISRFHLFMDGLVLRLPVVGSVVRYYNVANTSRTFGLLLKSGIKLSEATVITAETTRNLVYRRQFNHLTEVVNRGERLSAYLRRHEAQFPTIFGHMVAVGERSGSLSETLVYLSELYEHEVDEFTKNISTLIEPALMIVMGLVVGFIAISIITPIYGITQNLHG